MKDHTLLECILLCIIGAVTCFLLGNVYGRTTVECPICKETVCSQSQYTVKCEIPELKCPKVEVDCSQYDWSVGVGTESDYCAWESNQPTTCDRGLNGELICKEDEYAKKYSSNLMGRDNQSGCLCETRRCAR